MLAAPCRSARTAPAWKLQPITNCARRARCCLGHRHSRLPARLWWRAAAAPAHAAGFMSSTLHVRGARHEL